MDSDAIALAIDWGKIVELAISALVAVSGWFLASWLTLRRERLAQNEKRRYEYLVDVYNRITELRSNESREQEEFTQLFIEIQAAIELHGTQYQISSFRSIHDEISGGKFQIVDAPLKVIRSKGLSEVVLDLRNEIRAYLRLTKVNDGVPFMSYYKQRSHK